MGMDVSSHVSDVICAHVELYLLQSLFQIPLSLCSRTKSVHGFLQGSDRPLSVSNSTANDFPDPVYLRADINCFGTRRILEAVLHSIKTTPETVHFGI